MTKTLHDVISAFGEGTKSRLSNPAIPGSPEDQLRGPLEVLVESGLSEFAGLPQGAVAMVGETSLADIKTRPDYAVTVRKALVGFIEVKAPGKGADPRRFRDAHDREQWNRLRSLPNLLYTDGNAFSLWRDGELQGSVIHLDGDVETSGRTRRHPARPLARRIHHRPDEPASRSWPVGRTRAGAGGAAGESSGRTAPEA